MIGRLPRPRRNRNHGRQPRAAWWVRWPRLIRRKRVQVAQTGLRQALARVEREAGRLAHLAHVYDVPMDAMGALPAVPELPSQKWVDHLQALGDLVPVVKPAPQATPEQIQASA